MSMRSIYRKVAKEHGVTVAEVKRDMQEVINYAYTHTPDDGITCVYQNKVPRKGKIPTPDELIRYAAKDVKNREERTKH